MANWTDGKQHVFTQQDFDSKWGLHGGKNYCTLCNKDFAVGDKWRWVYGNVGNFQVCEQCDCPDVRDRHEAACKLVYESVKGRGKNHWPVDIAIQLIAEREHWLTFEDSFGKPGMTLFDAIASMQESLRQVDDFLMDGFIAVDDGNPDYKKALGRCVNFNMQIATDHGVNGGDMLFTKEDRRILRGLLKDCVVGPEARKVVDKLETI